MQSDLERRTLGIGDPTSASKASGGHNARWASLDVTPVGAAVGAVMELDLPHDLGETPTVVTLESYENASGAVTISARGVRRENWSHSHVHVEVTLLAGSCVGCVAHFRVQGK